MFAQAYSPTRQDTREKPFSCPFCPRSFQRSDVKAVHVRTCAAAPSDAAANEEALASSTRRRVRVACLSCRLKRIRCDGTHPCAACISSAMECEYSSMSGPVPGSDVLSPAPSVRNPSVSTRPATSPSLPIATPPQSNPDAEAQTATQLSLAMIPNDTTEVSALTMPDLDVAFPLPLSGEVDDLWFGPSMEYFHQRSHPPSPSLDKASKMWYSAPPNLDDYDHDILHVFISLFHGHIPKTFATFRENLQEGKTRAEYTLAMAATGGLFCSVPGSAEVAKTMYHDSRRLLLAFVSPAHTVMVPLLQANCSASTTVQKRMTPPSRMSTSWSLPIQLLESLLIFDCHRVIVMQRPPSLVWHHVSVYSGAPGKDGRAARLQRAIADAADGRPRHSFGNENEFPFATLAAITPHLWPVVYPRRNSYGADDVLVDSLLSWTPEFAELACDKWLQDRGPFSDWTHLVAFHMMNMMLHANIPVLQSFAHSAPGSQARDATRTWIGTEVRSWAQDRHAEIARWHAEHLIQTVEGALTSAPSGGAATTPHGRSSSWGSSSVTAPRRLPYEAPHVPYGIYHASIILWCTTLLQSENAALAAVAHTHIVWGERLLSLHRLHVAQLLAHVLLEIK
ncbi:hypothetical protein ANO11243_049440 [Dothideomycetidae sp. 11243]|nr:hypothetical protein ANO11243_049440 [fungal sp. No.11243]